MAEGSVIFDGDPERALEDERVHASYLGGHSVAEPASVDLA
jgi:ABC-type branched-subunit amino acid transport system ATPase component